MKLWIKCEMEYSVIAKKYRILTFYNVSESITRYHDSSASLAIPRLVTRLKTKN